jgi:hypothetical protein
MRWLVLALTLGTARAFTLRAGLGFTRATTTPLGARRPACSEHNVPGFFSSILAPLVTGTPASGRTVAEEFSHGLNESSRTFSHGLNESSRTFAEVISQGLNESSRTFAESLTEPARLQGSEAAGMFTRSATGMGLIWLAVGHPMGGVDPGLARKAVRLVLGSFGGYRLVCQARVRCLGSGLAHPKPKSAGLGKGLPGVPLSSFFLRL